MQKVYLLLRNNRQTGPYSLEELVQMGLKPFDLIWVEGKSFGWSYPAEIEQLKPYAPAQEAEPLIKESRETADLPSAPIYTPESKVISKAPDVKKIFVSMPGNAGKAAPVPKTEKTTDALEQKAEELRKRAQAYTAEKDRRSDTIGLETKYARPLADVEEYFTSWVYTQKVVKKTSPAKKYAKPVVVSLLVIVAGLLIVETVFNNEPAPVAAINTPLQTNANAQELTRPDNDSEEEQEVVMQTPEANNPVDKSSEEQAETTQTLPQVKKQKAPVVLKIENKRTTTATPIEEPRAKEPIMADSEEVIAKTKEQVEVVQPEKKKTFGEKIDGFFDKLKNKREERKAASTTDQEGERNATHRDEVGAETVDLAESVKVTANERSNDWMMGIQGLKLSLRNNSNLTVKSAEVEVRYFNEDKTLLEKKVIQFTNIPPKKSVTLPAPDHRTADHIDYQVLSAKGTTDGYARQ